MKPNNLSIMITKMGTPTIQRIAILPKLPITLPLVQITLHSFTSLEVWI